LEAEADVTMLHEKVQNILYFFYFSPTLKETTFP